MSGGTRWDRDAGRSLRAARSLAGHTQSQCAEALRSAGAPSGSQAAVSEWERGSSAPSAAAQEAVRHYMRQYHTAAGATAPEVPNGRADAFDGIAGRIAGEPLLGPRQAALVDALTARLRSGPAMSDADERTAASLVAVLGLPDPASEGP